MFSVRSVIILFSLLGMECVQADDFCTDDDDNTLYCEYGCCGIDDEYCCDDTWGTGSIAGTAVGLTFFCLFVALIVVCCRRRRRLALPSYVRQQNPASNTSVTVVQSSNAQQLNSVAANVAPANPQYPAPSQYPQPGNPPPTYPEGSIQPPPYTAS